jgi:hypothetical protein
MLLYVLGMRGMGGGRQGGVFPPLAWVARGGFTPLAWVARGGFPPLALAAGGRFPPLAWAAGWTQIDLRTPIPSILEAYPKCYIFN